MSASKREREIARRRHERWEVRRRAQVAQRRRVAVAWVTVLAVILGTVAGAIALAGTPAGSGTPAPVSSAPGEDAAPGTPGYDAPPSPDLAEGRTWPVTLATSAGPVSMELDGAAAPQAVASFLLLGRDGFFDGTACHRLVQGSLLQCGDPTGTGTGGPGYSFGPVENAPADQVYPAGTVAMARRAADASSQGSQFFLVFADTTLPDDVAGGYTVFGRITEGLDVLTAIDTGGTVDGGTDGQPANPVIIEGVVIP